MPDFRLATVFGVSPRPRLDLLVNDTAIAYYDKAIVLFESHFKRNYLHIDDACDAFLFAINRPDLSGECYNLGLSEANYSKLELCEQIKKVLPDFVYFESARLRRRQGNYIVSNSKIESCIQATELFFKVYKNL